jgi:hypothetical protein
MGEIERLMKEKVLNENKAKCHVIEKNNLIEEQYKIIEDQSKTIEKQSKIINEKSKIIDEQEEVWEVFKI